MPPYNLSRSIGSSVKGRKAPATGASDDQQSIRGCEMQRIPLIRLTNTCCTLIISVLLFSVGTARSQTYTAAKLTLGSAYYPKGIAVLGDFNGDGLMDVFAEFGLNSGQGCGEIGVWLQQANHTFKSTPSKIVNYGSNCMTAGYARAADANGDGKMDVILADNNILEVYVGNGDGTFSGPDTIYYVPVPDGPTQINAVDVGKLTSSGPPDIAILQTTSGFCDETYDISATVFTDLVLKPTVSSKQVTSEAYCPSSSFFIDSRTGHFLLPSMNGNGFDSAQLWWNNEDVLTGSSTGLLSYASTLSSPILCTGLDVNGDGVPDCVGYDYSSNQMLDIISPLGADKSNVLFTLSPPSTETINDVFSMQYGSTKRDFGYTTLNAPKVGLPTFSLIAEENNGSGTFASHVAYSISSGRTYIDAQPGGGNQRTYVLVTDLSGSYYVLQGGTL